MSSGTTTIPPPTPNSALKKPGRRDRWRRAAPPYPTAVELPPPLAAARARARAGRRPARRRRRARADRRRPGGRARPRRDAAELRRLHGRYALVACVSGRSGEDAAHRRRGRARLRRRARPRARAGGRALARAAARLRRHRRLADVSRSGSRSPSTTARAPDEDEAVRVLEAVAARAPTGGLVARWGRKVLELRPPIEAHKGTAVARLLEGAACVGRSTPATTRPTSTRSRRSTASTSASRSPSRPPRARRAPRGRRPGRRRPRGGARAPEALEARPRRASASASAACSSSSRRMRRARRRCRRRDRAPTRRRAWKPSTSASGSAVPAADRVLGAGRRDRGERGDAERAADLLRGVDQPEARPGLGRLRRPRAPRSRSARTRTPSPSRSPGTRAAGRPGTSRRPRPA